MNHQIRRRQAQSACACLLLVLLLSCSRPAAPEGKVVFDFAASFLQARQHFETQRLDFGFEPARAAMLSGFSDDESWGEESTSFVWGTGATSALRFYYLPPSASPLRLRFRCRSIYWLGIGPQVIGVFVNDAKVGDVSIPPGGFALHEIAIPATVLRIGANRLEFRYARFSRPPEGHFAAKDPRQLAVAWDWLALSDSRRPTIATESPKATSDGGKILLPFGSQLDYFLPLPLGSRLRVEAISSWGAGEVPPDSRLEVQVEKTGPEPNVHRFHLAPSLSSRELELEGLAGEMVRVSFIAHSWKGATGDTGLALANPSLLGQGSPDSGPGAEQSSPPLAEAKVPLPTSPTPSSPPNILLYVVDTLRADHLGMYGYERPVSPHFDAFAADGVAFTQAYAQSGWTKTSVTSILSGLSPLAHRVFLREDSLPEALPTLPKTLRSAGYETVGVVSNPTVAAEFGFARDFDHFVPLYREQSADGRSARSSRVNDEFFKWLEAGPHKAPFFAYLHTMDPHDPYTPPEPFRSRFAGKLSTDLNTPRHETMMATLARNPGLSEKDLEPDLIGLYDSEIAANDEQFGFLMDRLKRAGLYDNTLIVFVSDHGEEFRDHGYWGHGHSLYRELLHIPLVMKYPGSAVRGLKLDQVVQQVDIFPSLLTAAGVALPSGLSGQSLLPLLSGASASVGERPVLSYLRVDSFDVISIISGGRHLLSHNPQKPELDFELYNILVDPHEKRSLAAEDELWAGHLLGLLRAQSAALSRDVDAPQLQMDDETAARLRALGYIR